MSKSNSSWAYKLEGTIGQVPCQNCGRLVTVSLPFVGCVFCGDCAKGDSAWDASSEYFFDKRRLGRQFA